MRGLQLKYTVRCNLWPGGSFNDGAAARKKPGLDLLIEMCP